MGKEGSRSRGRNLLLGLAVDSLLRENNGRLDTTHQTPNAIGVELAREIHSLPNPDGSMPQITPDRKPIRAPK